MRTRGLLAIIGLMLSSPSSAHDETPFDSESEWSLLVSLLPETARLFLTGPASDREEMYRDLLVSRRASFGAILLELSVLDATR